MSEVTCASFKTMPLIPNNILTKLVEDKSEDAEQLWKLLKYTSTKALSEQNLTREEKMNMVFDPDKLSATRTQDTFNVFLKPLNPASLNTSESQTQLRIYRYKTTAISVYQSVITYEFDIMVNESSDMVRAYENILVPKLDYMEMLLVNLLNCMDIGVGVNFLRFTRMQGASCESVLNINNAKSTYGRSFLLALSYIDASLGGDCNG